MRSLLLLTLSERAAFVRIYRALLTNRGRRAIDIAYHPALKFFNYCFRQDTGVEWTESECYNALRDYESEQL